MKKLSKLEEIKLDFDPFLTKKKYKVYNDGGHYVASLVIPSNKKHQSNHSKDEMCSFFDNIYFDAVKQNLTENEIFSFVKEQLTAKYGVIDNIDDFITAQLTKKKHNFFSRIKRFRRKANLNYWNYFVTITYDNKKHNDVSFRNKLKKCLANLHTRYGWKYMGVFELSPEKQRLHFHAIMYIPDCKMIGKIEELKDYSTAQHQMQITHSNSFFAKKFGRNDFVELTEDDLKNGKTINYLVKYLYKTNEKITYSRGIPTEIYKYIDDKDIATPMFDFVLKYVLFDDVIDTFKDVMHFKYHQMTLFDNYTEMIM